MQTTSPIESDLVKLDSENDLGKVITELFKAEGLTKKTDLRRNEVNRIALLYAIAKKYKFKELEDIIDVFLELRISIDRKGRKEIVDVARSIIQREELDRMKKEAEKVKRIND